MTLTIKTKDQYITLFEQSAKEIGADDQADSEIAVLDHGERSYRQVDAAERGDVKLRSLDDFLRTMN